MQDKTWSRDHFSRVPFASNAILNLCINQLIKPTEAKGKKNS